MNCTRVDHVGIAVKDLAASVKWYEETLGLHSKGTEVVQEQQVTVAFLPCGDSELELLESTSPEGPSPASLRRTARAFSTSPSGWTTLTPPWRS